MPDTDFNSWTTIDGCDPYKDGNKVNKTKIYAADHSAEFLSLLEADAKAPRQPDGSIPENSFTRLVAGSKFVDAGVVIDNFIPVRFMTEAEAAAGGVELITAEPVTIEYNGVTADMGAYESGVATAGKLYVVGGEVNQLVYAGDQIEPVTIKWGGAATDVTVEGAVGLAVEKDAETKTVVISGTLSATRTVTVTTVGGETAAVVTLTFTASTVAPGTLVCVSGNASQTAFYGEPVQEIVFQRGGGASAFEVEGLADGLTATVDGDMLTISGVPARECTYRVTATGGMKDVSLTGRISLEIANRVLTGDWYHIQDEMSALPEDLREVVGLEQGDSYVTVWDPAYTESDESAPAGCTSGAVNVERGGALVWTLPSLLELKANVHFTGGRYLVVKYQVEGEPERVWTSEKLKKTTLTGWDLMQEAGIEPVMKPVTVKFFNDGGLNNGGIRIYDFYVKVARDVAPSGLTETAVKESLPWYYTGNAVVVNRDDVAGVAVYDLAGRMVNSTVGSAVLPLGGAPSGMYILQVVYADGSSVACKIQI